MSCLQLHLLNMDERISRLRKLHKLEKSNSLPLHATMELEPAPKSKSKSKKKVTARLERGKNVSEACNSLFGSDVDGDMLRLQNADMLTELDGVKCVCQCTY